MLPLFHTLSMIQAMTAAAGMHTSAARDAGRIVRAYFANHQPETTAFTAVSDRTALRRTPAAPEMTAYRIPSYRKSLLS